MVVLVLAIRYLETSFEPILDDMHFQTHSYKAHLNAFLCKYQIRWLDPSTSRSAKFLFSKFAHPSKLVLLPAFLAKVSSHSVSLKTSTKIHDLSGPRVH